MNRWILVCVSILLLTRWTVFAQDAPAAELDTCLIVPALDGVVLGDVTAATLTLLPTPLPLAVKLLLWSIPPDSAIASPDGQKFALLVSAPASTLTLDHRTPFPSVVGDNLDLLLTGSVTELYVVEPAVGRVELIAQNAHDPYWSQNGDRLGYRVGDTFMIVTLTDGERTEYALPPHSIGLSWSPDGTAVATQTGIDPITAYPQSITVTQLATGESVTLAYTGGALIRMYSTSSVVWTVECDLVAS